MPTTKKTTTPKSTKKPDLMTASLRAIRAAWPSDPTSPGVTLSLLKSGEWYVSINRYTATWANGKYVVHSAKAISWESALKQCMNEFIDDGDILSALKKALK